MLIECVLVLMLGAATISGTYSRSRVYLDRETGGYNDIAIIISPDLKAADCPRILEDIKDAFTEASESLYNALDQEVFFGSIDILVPQNWTASDCQTPLNLHRASGRQAGDFYIGPNHPTYKHIPWTQQSLGCGQSGDFVYIPASFIWSTTHKRTNDIASLSNNSSSDESETTLIRCGDEIRDRWLQYRFGIFSADLDRVPVPGSQQDAFCLGRSPREIIRMHPDLKTGARNPGPLSVAPKFVVSRIEPPRYVLILENSAAMNSENHWDLLRTATKKLIVHDLPSEAQLGLVLFNDGAHIAHTVGVLTDSQTRRNGIAVQIENKFSLNPKSESCVRCGVIKAIEALQTSGSTVGATFILISQGKSTSLSSNFEKDLTDLSKRHRLQIFSIAIPTVPYIDLSLSLERLSHNTGGMSFFITEKSPLGIYVGLLGAFREIQRRTQIDGPYLIHENHFYSQGPSEETGSFVIDKYIGPKTSFNCFALYPGNTENGYVKSISLEDKKGNKFKSIVDSMAYYHILSLYNVPFELDQNVGMNWTYLIERLAAPLDNSGDNEHIVQITSRPRKVDDFINVHFFTNLNTHSSEVSNRRPIKFFVELKLNEVPVLDARVKVQIHVINLSGHKTESVWVELLDNGNGDPDMSGNDGIYSRYLTDFSLKEGRYSISVHVNDNQGRAFSFQKERSYGGRSCCKGGDSNEFDSIINQKLGSFSRILTGDSFRLHSILDSDSMPPSRILDLAVNVHRDTHELEFLWTAPGDDYDRGQVTAYKLYSSPSVGSFYSSLNTTTLLGEIAASKIAGRRESHRIKVSDFNKNLFYTLVPIDGQGNTGAVSNVRGAFMPSPEKESKLSKGDSAAALVDSDSDSHDVVVVNHKKPDKIIVFLAIGVLAFVVICVISVISIIVLLNRRKKSGGDNLSAEDQSIYGDSDDHHEYHPTIAPSSVYDEQELMKEFEKRHFLTSSNLTDSNTQYSDRNYPYSINNTIHSSWTKNQPMIQRAPLPQPPPLYAVPVPRSQRPRFNDHLCTSSPQTPSSSMNSGNTQPRGETMANQSEPIYNNQTLQNLVDTLTQEFANENAMSYLEGTTTYMDHYYSNLYNTEERLSQSSSNTTADGQTPQKKDGNIKSILKKRDQSSNEHLTPISGSNSSHSSQERFENDDEKNREIEERLWADLSPTRVFLETSFESKFEGMRPPVIQEMTEEEEDDQPPTNPHQPVELLVTERQEEDLPPPPTSLELAGSLETFTTPVKIADVSLSSGLSERKRRNITQV